MARTQHSTLRRSGRPAVDAKPCATCGRTIEWRKKWEHDWAEVRYCSDRCRRSKVGPIDAELEDKIIGLLDRRAAGATICPSEAARLVGARHDIDWRPLMEPARAAARRLVANGKIEITQRGRVVDPSTAKGPIRLRSTRRHA